MPICSIVTPFIYIVYSKKMHFHSVENDAMHIVLIYVNIIPNRCALFMNDRSHMPATHDAIDVEDR